MKDTLVLKKRTWENKSNRRTCSRRTNPERVIEKWRRDATRILSLTEEGG